MTKTAKALPQPPPAVFLPDLCGFTALFLVAVVSELVAVIIVVGSHGFVRGFIDELALLSLYTQWLGQWHSLNEKAHSLSESVPWGWPSSCVEANW